MRKPIHDQDGPPQARVTAGALQVAVPPVPVAVPVYVVGTPQLAGCAVFVPFPTGETGPTELLIENESALVVVQVSVVAEPLGKLVGLADSVQVGAGAGGPSPPPLIGV